MREVSSHGDDNYRVLSIEHNNKRGRWPEAGIIGNQTQGADSSSVVNKQQNQHEPAGFHQPFRNRPLSLS